MNIVKQVATLLKEADLYHKQGLLEEAMAKYDKAKGLVQNDPVLRAKQNLTAGISKKAAVLKKDMDKVAQASTTPTVSPEVQKLIKRLYTFSAEQDEDTVALDGAIALAKFGQYDSALSEFSELLKKESLRVVAAKNILRCYMAMSSVDEAFTQYEQWLSSDLFVPEQLDNLKKFFEKILENEGVSRGLPTPSATGEAEEPVLEMLEAEEPRLQDIEAGDDYIDEFEFEDDEDAAEEILDINSIRLTPQSGPREGQTLELIVNFQSGNVISLLIPSRDKDLVESFKVGDTIDNIEYYSPIAIFNSPGTVTEVVQIKTGPRRGDYNLDIKVIDH